VRVRLTDFTYDLIVLQHAPSDVHAVVVPVRARHLLVDICVDARHSAAGLGKAQRKTGRDHCVGGGFVLFATSGIDDR
jgi:hypothetical protein